MKIFNFNLNFKKLKFRPPRFTRLRRRLGLDKLTIKKGYVLIGVALIFVLIFSFMCVRAFKSYQALQNKASWAAALKNSPQSEGTNYLFYGLYNDGDEVIIEDIFFLNFGGSSEGPHIIYIPGNSLLHRSSAEGGAGSQGGTSTQSTQSGTSGTPGDGAGAEGEGAADGQISQDGAEAPEGGEDGQGDADSPEGAEVQGASRPAENQLVSYYTPGNFYQDGGAEMFVSQIAYNLGVPLHHYLEINYSGIPGLVNYRKGIEYRGYLLKGEDYIDYFLRGESGMSPMAKAMYRTNALKGLVDLARKKEGFFATPRVMRRITPYMDTDLSWRALKKFYSQAESLFNPESFVTQLPGAYREINGELFYEPDRDQITLLMANLGEDLILPREMITIEILNGSGIAGVAGKMADKLRGYGFIIESGNIGNAEQFDYQRTQVISRLDDVRAAKQVVEAIPDSDFIKEPIPGHHVMVTIIVGIDETF